MINKKDTELLTEIQNEITADVEMMETVYAEIDEVLKAPENYKTKDLSPELKNILAVKKRKESDYQSFIRELTELSKEYGIAIKSIGGVQIGKIKEIEYSNDETCGDLIPTVKWGRIGDRIMANLTKIDINEIFKTNQDVRNWLLENPKELEDALNIELVNIGHHSIIPNEVRPDIYAEENMSHNKVIVMINLEEPTDEEFKTLLGMAAGYNANKAVWLVKNLDDKTRYILNWLNERTGWKTEFIVLKVEAYKIEYSLPAMSLVRI